MISILYQIWQVSVTNLQVQREALSFTNGRGAFEQESHVSVSRLHGVFEWRAAPTISRLEIAALGDQKLRAVVLTST
jgi:hypothetical protein